MAAMTPPYMLPLPVRQHLAKAGWPGKGLRHVLAPKPHGKMTWDIYFKICSNVPTPCEKNLVSILPKVCLVFLVALTSNFPMLLKNIAKVTRCDTSSQRPWLRKLRKRFAKDQLCLRWHNCVIAIGDTNHKVCINTQEIILSSWIHHEFITIMKVNIMMPWLLSWDDDYLDQVCANQRQVVQARFWHVMLIDGYVGTTWICIHVLTLPDSKKECPRYWHQAHEICIQCKLVQKSVPPNWKNIYSIVLQYIV